MIKLILLFMLLSLHQGAYAIDPKDMVRVSILIEGVESIVGGMTTYCSEASVSEDLRSRSKQQSQAWQTRNDKYISANNTYVKSIEGLVIFNKAREINKEEIARRAENFKANFFHNYESEEAGCNNFLMNLSSKRFDFTRQPVKKSLLLNEFVKEINDTFTGE